MVLFVQAKRIKPFPFRELSRFSKPRFSSPQWRLRTNPIKTFSKRELRGFPNLESAHPNNNFAQTQLNPSAACLLETWSPCSHPFAILPVSAVSDVQKLATGNFLHVRAAFLSACGGALLLPQQFFAASRLLSSAMPTFLLPAATGRRLRRLFLVADATFPPLRGGAIAKDCIKAPP